MIHNRLTHSYVTLVVTTIFVCLLLAAGNAPAKTELPRTWMDISNATKTEMSNDLTALYRAMRAVISQQQKHINNANVGDKGLNGERVIEMGKENYRQATGRSFVQVGSGEVIGKAQYALLESTMEVMADAQSLINQRGRGFKGFLPAIFAAQVATKFNAKMEGIMAIKLTAPVKYVRNQKNRPDMWEANVIEGKFSLASHKKGKPYWENTYYKDKSAYRYILPEYYVESCMSCHGGPKGTIDITGAKREGGIVGELGGAISFVIYNQ